MKRLEEWQVFFGQYYPPPVSQSKVPVVVPPPSPGPSASCPHPPPSHDLAGASGVEGTLVVFLVYFFPFPNAAVRFVEHTLLPD